MAQPSRRPRLVLVAGVLATLAVPARAQQPTDPPAGPDDDAPAAEDGAAPADAPAAAPAEALPETLPPAPPPLKRWAGDHRWAPSGLSARIVDAVAGPTGTIVALDRDGALWRSTDGRSWRQVHSSGGQVEEVDPEDLLIDAEATIDELLGSEEIEDVEESDEGVEIEPEDIDLDDTITDIALVDVEERRDGAADGLGGLWVDPANPRVLMAGLDDGLWISRDDGNRWSRAAELVGVRAFLSTRGELLVGNGDGLWRSIDGGRRFEAVLPGVGARAVHVLTQDQGLLLAGTSQGLWRRELDGRWTQVPATAELEVFDILTDPGWEGGLWLATSDGLLRSDDLGYSVRQASRNPLRGVRTLLALGRTGHVLAAGADGVWETVDGGTSWAPLANGLSEPIVRALALVRGQPFLFGRAGAWQLQRPGPEEADDAAAAQRIPSLDDIVDRALDRPGLSLDGLSISRKVVLARFTPRLELLGRYEPRLKRDTDYLSSVTREDQGPKWLVELKMCWGLCSDTVSVYGDFGDTVEYSDIADLAVVGDQVYDFSTDSSVPVAAANVASRAITYRSAVADIVTKAWFARRQLAVDGTRVAALPLADQVAYQLRVEEVDARLDLYTDGWYGRALHSLSAQAATP